jgi:uncharacterized membrane protein
VVYFKKATIDSTSVNYLIQRIGVRAVDVLEAGMK